MNNLKSVDSVLDEEEIASENIPKGWTKAPSIEDLKLNFTDSQSSHSAQVAKVQGWLDQLNITGSAKRPKIKGKSNVQPKLIRKQAEWRYAALSEPFLATEDIFQVAPVSFEDKKAANQNQLVLNHQFNNKIDKVAFTDEYVRAGVDEGTIIVRVGWVSEEEDFEKEVSIYEFFPAQSNEEVAALQPYAEIAQSDPAAFEAHAPDHIKQALQLTNERGQPIIPRFKENRIITETRFIRNEPTVEVCDFNNLTIDPSCNGNLSKAEFAILSFETSTSELGKKASYFNLDKIKPATSGSVLAQADHTTANDDGFTFKDDARAKIVAYEYWGWWDVDGSGTTIPIVATWVGDILIRLEENPYPFKGIPFVKVQYLPVRKEVHGEPDGALLKDNQDIVGAVTRGAIDLMAKSANAQTGMRKDALDAVNKRRYDKGMDYEFNPSVDPRQAIINHTYPEIPNSVSLMLGIQHNEAESLTGVKAFTGGISGDSLGDTATSVRGALDAASKRELGILRRLAKGFTDIGKMIIAMNGEFLSDKEIIRITNEEFIAIKREELAGNFDLKLSISTAEEDNQKAQELAFMLQTGAASSDPAEVRMIRAEIARLRRMPDLAKKIEDYKPEPDPMQQQIQMLEMKKLEAEIAEIQSRTMENQAEAQLDVAKSGTEYAKQGQMKSDTDQKDLDFLDQESGLKHTREVEQNAAQSEGNMALAILNNQLEKELPKNQPKVS